MPPFGTFVSKFTIIASAASEGRFLVLAGLLAPIAWIFVSMTRTALGMILEPPSASSAVGSFAWSEEPAPRFREPVATLMAPIGLATLSIALGLAIPRALDTELRHAARSVAARSVIALSHREIAISPRPEGH